MHRGGTTSDPAPPRGYRGAMSTTAESSAIDTSDETITRPRATFSAMAEGTQEDWNRIVTATLEFYPGLADRVIAHLRLLGGDFGGFQVDRLTHSLQTATRAYRADRDDEYVACALLHDIGDTLGSFNHADIAAAIVKPFVSEEYHWMVDKHAIFQGYYFFHYLGLDRNLRDQFAGHPCYDLTDEFTAEFDQPAFDPNYPTMALEEFEPLLQSFFANPKRSLYLPDSPASD
jgi:predicted HD phosphohydrolase